MKKPAAYTIIAIALSLGTITAQGQDDLTPEELEVMERLDALGYLGETTVEATRGGVTRVADGVMMDGYRLYCSGHAPAVYLVDVSGAVVHAWSTEPWRVPGSFKKVYHPSPNFIRKCRLLPNGDLLAIFDGIGLMKLDKDSEVVWKVRNRAHHHLEILNDGRILVLRHNPRVIPWMSADEIVVDDVVALLDADGRPIESVSTTEAILNSPDHRDKFKRRAKQTGDVLHTNAVQRIDESLALKVPGFQAGNWVVTSPRLRTVMTINPSTWSVEWAHQGTVRSQHDARLLPNGNLLVFDNQGAAPHSRAIEFTVPDMKPEWVFIGSEAEPFYTASAGTCQRLPNGNTLITETEGGRVIEVTKQREVVWEFVNPNATDGGKVASIFEMEWIAPDYPTFLE